MSPRSLFRSSLSNEKEFTITFELVPGRGSSGKRLDRLLEFGEAARKDGRIKSLSITDNPGGHPALSPTALGIDIQSIGIEPLLHFSLKDKNRNLAESQLFECHRLGLTSILVLGGDFPRRGYHGQALPVFDLDSTQLLLLIKELHKPAPLLGKVPGSIMELPAMDFLAGCVVSPFKATIEEQIYQYKKLLGKVACGANFIISQLGFDMDKYRELIHFCRKAGISIPLLGNIFIPSLAVAKIMHQGGVPGVILSSQLLKKIQREAQSRDNGEEARLIRGAKMMAVLKGLGYSGVHIGGNNLNFSATAFMLDYLEEHSGNWQDFYQEIHFPVPKTWYMEQNSPISQKRARTHLSFKFNQLSHRIIFSPKSFLFPLVKKISLFADNHRKTGLLYTLFEHLIKKILFRCKMCGDCTLAESSFLCPQSGCPKKMTNGPCGGSINGFCEVYPKERLCFWVKVYRHEQKQLDPANLQASVLLPPKDWSLADSSSWLNYFSGRDHNKLP